MVAVNILAVSVSCEDNLNVGFKVPDVVSKEGFIELKLSVVETFEEALSDEVVILEVKIFVGVIIWFCSFSEADNVEITVSVLEYVY
jgi:2,3-bisphosphoglycerate-independent phosphoglycerate mutase